MAINSINAPTATVDPEYLDNRYLYVSVFSPAVSQMLIGKTAPTEEIALFFVYSGAFFVMAYRQ